MSKILLIDGNAILHRAYHAIPPLTSPKGELVNAVYGFFLILLGAIQKLEPKYIVVAVDVSGPTFRDDLYDKYKATRTKAPQSLYDQIPIIHNLLKCFEIPTIGVKGYEADDVIGTLATRIMNYGYVLENVAREGLSGKSESASANDGKDGLPVRGESASAEEQSDELALSSSGKPSTSNNDDLEVIIVTGDQDAVQLVNDRVKIFTMRNGLKDTILLDTQAVKEKYGFSPLQMIDYKALRGDPSDNIPGVPGIGDKTACLLIKEYQTLENILKNTDQLPEKIKKKIVGHEQEAILSKTLATIHTEVPFDFDLEQSRLHDFDQERIENEFRKLGMKSLIARMPKSTRKKVSHTQGTLL